MGIDIIALAKECPDMVVSIKLSDLLTANRNLLDEAQLQAEQNLKALKPQQEEYISREKAMEILGVSGPTLWRWMKTEYLIPTRLGTKVRYRMSDIQQILEGDNNGK